MRRRSFLHGSVITLGSMLLPQFAAKAMGEGKYEIIARHASHPLAGPDHPKTDLMLYGGQSPGPLLTIRKSETLEITFKNRLSEPSTIHWHGIRNLNEMDGVPGLTQPNVEPGEDFVYRFPANDAGTFWYHAHNMAWKQVSYGLYGPLIVLDDGEDLGLDNVVLVADDWRLTDEYQIHSDSLGSLHDWSHAGRMGNWLTINGTSQPEIPVASEGLIKLRLINAANARVMKFALEGDGLFEIVAIDGASCHPFHVKHCLLAPAQRLDVLIPAEKISNLMEVSNSLPVKAARFKAVKNKSKMRISRPRSTPWYEKPNIENAKHVKIHMQGGAMGNLSAAEYHGQKYSLRELAQEHSKLWAFNSVVGGYHNILAEVDLMQTVALDVFNDSRWQHAIHLHGHHFWVKSSEFEKNPFWILRDTYLMQPHQKAQLIFVADNPGKWLFHCHMLEHHAAGMGGVISVV